MTTKLAPERAGAAGWSIAAAADLYRVDGWSQGYFSIGPAGTVLVHPERDPERAIDLYEVVQGLAERDITAPVLIRFRDILQDRVRTVAAAFEGAIRDNDYRGDYFCVYPIKVNQQRHVVEVLREAGSAHGFGLEAGSKPELLAVLGLTAVADQVPIVCNGFKDSEFIETVILATKLGRRIIPVVEKFSELELIVRHAERYDVRPTIGVRVKLSARGAGRWESSGGLRSKFGLYVSEIIDAVDFLKARGMEDCLQLLHCHIGSQVFDIRRIKTAITELAHVYAEVARLGAGMRYLDIGGGLGIDYDGSGSSLESSINYTLEEYAADVVYRIAAVCDDAEIEHPTIVSESGRALTAYHSVLVCDVLGSTSFDSFEVPESVVEAVGADAAEEAPQPLWDLYEAFDLVRDGRLEEAYHDALQAHEEALNLFNLGYMDLKLRALSEKLYWAICARIVAACRRQGEMPEEFRGLAGQLSDIYFCNMSIFQSLPDSWAIDQIFPVLPIHRLDEPPTREAILADITCDSEGKVDAFVSGSSQPKRTLDLHPLRAGEPYYLGAFLVGAYQETLGDLHNLFGDTHAVHIAWDEDGEWEIEELIPGDTVREVLAYVQFEPSRLLEDLRKDVERARRKKILTVGEGRQLLSFYSSGLDGYTYLEEELPGEP